MPSANTIGIESRIRAAKMMATVASSINDSGSVLGLALRQRGDHHRKTIDGDQDATDDRRGVEPGEIDLEAGRHQCAVEQAELEAVPGCEHADADDEGMIETVDPELRGFRQAMHEHGEREMRTRLNPDRRADQ